MSDLHVSPSRYPKPTIHSITKPLAKFVTWSTTHTIDFRKNLQINKNDYTAMKVAKIFLCVVAAVALTPFAAAVTVYSKVKPNLPQSVTNFIANLHSKFPKLS